jgi:hypothetical protein
MMTEGPAHKEQKGFVWEKIEEYGKIKIIFLHCNGQCKSTTTNKRVKVVREESAHSVASVTVTGRTPWDPSGGVFLLARKICHWLCPLVP